MSLLVDTTPLRVSRDFRRLWLGQAALGGVASATFTVKPALVLVLFACAGAADMISGVYRSTIAAAVTPDDLRGRVSGVELVVHAGGPVVGDIEAGVVGGVAGVPFAIVSGGVACVIGAAKFAGRVPPFARDVRASLLPSGRDDDG